ncbi:MAG: TonB-dependent receptor [Ferruginibacter sp.]|nr:TonB-dependent receptor [Cytophagales bacterium]
MKKSILTVLLGVWFGLAFQQAPAQPKTGGGKVTVNGYVRDAASGEALIGATVFVKELATGTATNGYGFYSLTLPPGDYLLTYRYLGYESLSNPLALTGNLTRDVNLSDQRVQMKEVVIAADKPDDNVKSTDMSVNKLDIRTIRMMPALLGEVDVVRSIQLLPGVSTVGEGASGFNVRGGGVDQNLILLDEAPVYNSSHLFGFFSVFNPDAVKDIKLLKGGIPAQYGGRLSSLLDVRMKEGNSKRLTASGGIGTVSSRLTVEAPLVKDKSSFIVAARRSYADLLLKVNPEQANNQAYFYDLSAKVNYTINENNKVYASGYFGKDVFKFGDEFRTDWGNATATVRWNHLFSKRLFANFTGIYSNYDYRLGVPTGSEGFDWKSNIVNYSTKADFTYYLNPKNTINFGASAILYRFQPAKITPLGGNSIFIPRVLNPQRATEYALYLDDEQVLSSRLSVQYGLRLSMFDYLGAATVYDYVGPDGFRKTPANPRTFGKNESVRRYANLEPRASARYTLTETSSLKASYHRMAQYIHLISNTTAASPLDVWSPSTSNIRPEIADQVALGYFRNFRDDAYEFSVETFYKTMSNQVDYINGADLLLNDNLEGELLYGQGRAYGAEFYLKKNAGKLTGWVSYTLSRSERQINGINLGRWYPNKYDKTHNLAVVGLYALNERWTLSGNFAYGTGVATTFPNGRYEQGGVVVPHNTTDSRNNYRVPAYHRVDVAATLQGRKKAGRRWESNWVFSVYNLYARRNAFTVYFRQNEDNPNRTEAVRLSVLGTVLPSVTYNFNF